MSTRQTFPYIHIRDLYILNSLSENYMYLKFFITKAKARIDCLETFSTKLKHAFPLLARSGKVQSNRLHSHILVI